MRTWDTAGLATVREIEEVFLEAQTAGRLVYRQTGDGRGGQVTLNRPPYVPGGISASHSTTRADSALRSP